MVLPGHIAKSPFPPIVVSTRLKHLLPGKRDLVLVAVRHDDGIGFIEHSGHLVTLEAVVVAGVWVPLAEKLSVVFLYQGDSCLFREFEKVPGLNDLLWGGFHLKALRDLSRLPGVGI